MMSKGFNQARHKRSGLVTRKKTDSSKLGKGVGQLEYSHLDGKSVNQYNHSGKLYGSIY